eukprot:10830357-Ditylum_brightwellii.AAC.1
MEVIPFILVIHHKADGADMRIGVMQSLYMDSQLEQWLGAVSTRTYKQTEGGSRFAFKKVLGSEGREENRMASTPQDETPPPHTCKTCQCKCGDHLVVGGADPIQAGQAGASCPGSLYKRAYKAM